MRDFDKYKTRGAYHFSWYSDPDQIWYKECVDRIVDFCKGSTLDVGCGDGLVSYLISENDIYVTGIDNDAEGIKLAEENGHIPELILQDITKPIKGEWEYMACLNVIEHLEKPDGILNILNNNITKGAIIITDKKTENKGRYHEKEYSLEELVEVFKEFNPKPFEINSTEFGKPISFVGVEIVK